MLFRIRNRVVRWVAALLTSLGVGAVMLGISMGLFYGVGLLGFWAFGDPLGFREETGGIAVWGIFLAYGLAPIAVVAAALMTFIKAVGDFLFNSSPPGETGKVGAQTQT